MAQADSSAADFHRRVSAAVHDASTVIDVGCGRGAHLRGSDAAEAVATMRSQGGTVIGIDVAVPDDGNPYVDEARAIEGNRWPVDDRWADVAYCDWVLEHVTDPGVFFTECSRVLKPGGIFIARTMQTWSVAGVGARAVPRRWHNALISKLQPGMNDEDLFPTALRCNTRRSLSRYAAAVQMQLLDVATHATLAGYGTGRPWVETALATVEKRLPASMRHCIVITARRSG